MQFILSTGVTYCNHSLVARHDRHACGVNNSKMGWDTIIADASWLPKKDDEMSQNHDTTYFLGFLRVFFAAFTSLHDISLDFNVFQFKSHQGQQWTCQHLCVWSAWAIGSRPPAVCNFADFKASHCLGRRAGKLRAFRDRICTRMRFLCNSELLQQQPNKYGEVNDKSI